jgi:hypothetical protein
MFLRPLPETMRTALADWGQLLVPLGELAPAADLLQHATPVLVATVVAVRTPGSAAPTPVNALLPPSVPFTATTPSAVLAKAPVPEQSAATPTPARQ